MNQTKPISSGERASRRSLVLWGGLSALAVIIVVAVIWRFALQRPAASGDPVKVAKYVASSRFLGLDFIEQRNYCKAMREAREALKSAREAERLSAAEYDAAKGAAWIGGKLEHLNDYLEQPTAKEKRAYIDKMLIRRQEKKTQAATIPLEIIDDSAAETKMKESKEVTRIVNTWSRRRKGEFEDFLKATSQRKSELAAQKTVKLQ
jgi:hypothetical protein